MGSEHKNNVSDEVVLDKIVTVPNIVTLIRLLLLPVYLVLLFLTPYRTAALVVFAIAASTDWVDGQIARKTHQVSKIGKLFDPLVDRLLIAVGVISVFLLGELPLWILIYLIARDLFLLAGGKYLLEKKGVVPPVKYVGKFATAFLMIGFCFLLLGTPYVPALGLSNMPSWLPGFGESHALLGIWFVYAGLICSVIALIIYIIKGWEINNSR